LPDASAVVVAVAAPPNPLGPTPPFAAGVIEPAIVNVGDTINVTAVV